MGHGISRIRPEQLSTTNDGADRGNDTVKSYVGRSVQKKSSVYQTSTSVKTNHHIVMVERNDNDGDDEESTIYPDDDGDDVRMVHIGVMTPPWELLPRITTVDQSVQTDIDFRSFDSMMRLEEQDRMLVDDDMVRVPSFEISRALSRFDSTGRKSVSHSFKEKRTKHERNSNNNNNNNNNNTDSESVNNETTDRNSVTTPRKKRSNNRLRDSGFFSVNSNNDGSAPDDDYYAKPVNRSSKSRSTSRRSVQRSRHGERDSADVKSSKNNSKKGDSFVKKSMAMDQHIRVSIQLNKDSDASVLMTEAPTPSSAMLDSDAPSLKERTKSPRLDDTDSSGHNQQQSHMSNPSVSHMNEPPDDLITSDFDDSTSDSSFGSNNISWTTTVRTGVEIDGRKTVNEYVLMKKLGKGTFGKVKLCRNKISGKLYAIKIINRSLLNKVKRDKQGRPHKVDGISDIKREVAILKKADHPNIVRLYEVIDDPKNEKLFMVFEFVENGAVLKMLGNDRIDRPPYDEWKARKYFRDLINGLEYLHNNKIVHRDIKPENLLIDNQDRLKLTDFGVSHMLEDDNDVLHTSAGTPAFLPPEACTIGSYKGKPSDIWSCGVTLYVMIFGSVPFTGAGILGTYKAIIHDDPPYPSDANPLLVDLFQKILEKDPDRRATISTIKSHPWVTNNGEYTFNQKNPEPVKVTEEEITQAISRGEQLKMIDKFVMMSKMKRRLAMKAKLARQNLLLKKSTYSSDADSADDASRETTTTTTTTTAHTSHSNSTSQSRILNLNINFTDQSRTLQLDISNDRESNATPDKKKLPFGSALDQPIIMSSNKVLGNNSPQLSYKPVNQGKKFSFVPTTNRR